MTASEKPCTVMLSDGSVWTLESDGWHKHGYTVTNTPEPMPWYQGRSPLTASDLRKIADVLDPPKELGHSDPPLASRILP